MTKNDLINDAFENGINEKNKNEVEEEVQRTISDLNLGK